MNVGLIFSRIGTLAKQTAGAGALMARKHAPELMIGFGIAGFAATIAETVRATNKTNEILEHRDSRMERIEEEFRKNDPLASAPAYSEADYHTDICAVSRQTKWDLAKTWTPVGTTAVVSVFLILGGYRILNGRYVATAAAYKMLEASTERYRSNVIREFGKDVDWRMAHSIKAEELEEERKKQDELREKSKSRIPRTQYSKDINNQIFDAHSSDRWKRYWIPSQVLDFVRQVESEIQNMVNERGFAFLNDAYDRLGMPLTSQGAIVGWIKTPGNRHLEKGTLVSLGFANDETPEEEIRRILSSKSNDDLYVWITPNCDGVIYQKIDVPFSER